MKDIKPIPLADEEWIRSNPSAFTVPARIAKLLAERDKRPQRQREELLQLQREEFLKLQRQREEQQKRKESGDDY